MKDIPLVRVHCYRCIYTWTPARSPVRICPRCKSRLWDVPKIRPVRLGKGLGMREIIEPNRKEILRLARKYHAGRVRVFGSVRRAEADSHSDVDLLVRFTKHSPPLAALDLKIELKELLGRDVDVADERRLPWFIRPYAMAEAVPV